MRLILVFCSVFLALGVPIALKSALQTHEVSVHDMCKKLMPKINNGNLNIPARCPQAALLAACPAFATTAHPNSQDEANNYRVKCERVARELCSRYRYVKPKILMCAMPSHECTFCKALNTEALVNLNYDHRGWMGQYITDPIPFRHMLMPGSHDSGVFSGGGHSQTQVYSPYEQMWKGGVRFFDIRFKKHFRKWLTLHPVPVATSLTGAATYVQPLSETFADVGRFLVENPSEFVVYRIKLEGSKSDFETVIKNAINDAGIQVYRTANSGAPGVSDQLMDATYGNLKGKLVLMNYKFEPTRGPDPDLPWFNYKTYWFKDAGSSFDAGIDAVISSDFGNLPEAVEVQLEKLNAYSNAQNQDANDDRGMTYTATLMGDNIKDKFFAQMATVNANHLIAKGLAFSDTDNEHRYRRMSIPANVINTDFCGTWEGPMQIVACYWGYGAGADCNTHAGAPITAVKDILHPDTTGSGPGRVRIGNAYLHGTGGL